MSSRYLIVTDRRTDRQTDESNLNTALCASASRGKNGKYRVGLIDINDSTHFSPVSVSSRVSISCHSQSAIQPSSPWELDLASFEWSGVEPALLVADNRCVAA